MNIESKIAPRHPRSAKEIIHSIGAGLSTLNLGTNISRQMPPIEPGSKGVKIFTEALSANRFTYLAESFKTVHAGELRKRKGKNFPSEQERIKHTASSRILRDLSETITKNHTILDSVAQINEDQHQSAETKIGELVLSFYENFLKFQEGEEYLTSLNRRVTELIHQTGFKPSPLMMEVGREVENYQYNFKTALTIKKKRKK